MHISRSPRGGNGLAVKGHEGFWVDGNSLGLDRGGSYICVRICQKSPNCTIKWMYFIVCKLYLNKTD